MIAPAVATCPLTKVTSWIMLVAAIMLEPGTTTLVLKANLQILVKNIP
ncbi:MAG: hypothetical protein KatS3mg112_0416 [Thermogutta sp.]|nr:MAG: hypothetical protein KatS3mg112_0416 [Thermogutta sp.]